MTKSNKLTKAKLSQIKADFERLQKLQNQLNLITNKQWQAIPTFARRNLISEMIEIIKFSKFYDINGNLLDIPNLRIDADCGADFDI